MKIYIELELSICNSSFPLHPGLDYWQVKLNIHDFEIISGEGPELSDWGRGLITEWSQVWYPAGGYWILKEIFASYYNGKKEKKVRLPNRAYH